MMHDGLHPPTSACRALSQSWGAATYPYLCPPQHCDRHAFHPKSERWIPLHTTLHAAAAASYCCLYGMTPSPARRPFLHLCPFFPFPLPALPIPLPCTVCAELDSVLPPLSGYCPVAVFLCVLLLPLDTFPVHRLPRACDTTFPAPSLFFCTAFLPHLPSSTFPTMLCLLHTFVRFLCHASAARHCVSQCHHRICILSSHAASSMPPRSPPPRIQSSLRPQHLRLYHRTRALLNILDAPPFWCGCRRRAPSPLQVR
ncbi:hypothetical protein EDB92DRAFT_1866749 [Lactarius akahatsu]|uniref:Uncharacterized protein n=1 Tax=Lactarius akahatsu TaxID=416441 RepID=A0AAD4LFL7_9AGAM|nr:hypothetical protein EDB92DRAFT_1866749 [Lactarius akahatsu]